MYISSDPPIPELIRFWFAHTVKFFFETKNLRACYSRNKLNPELPDIRGSEDTCCLTKKSCINVYHPTKKSVFWCIEHKEWEVYQPELLRKITLFPFFKIGGTWNKTNSHSHLDGTGQPKMGSKNGFQPDILSQSNTGWRSPTYPPPPPGILWDNAMTGRSSHVNAYRPSYWAWSNETIKTSPKKTRTLFIHSQTL